MGKNLVGLLLLGLLTPFLIQCVATQKDMQTANIKMQNIDTRVLTIDEEVERLKTETVALVQERLALSSNQIDRMEADILQLKAKHDENALQIRTLREENKELKAVLAGRMDSIAIKLEQKIDTQSETLASRLDAIDEQLRLEKTKLSAAETEIKMIQEARSQEAAARAKEAARLAREAAEKARMAASTSETVKTTADGPVQLVPEIMKRPPGEGDAVISEEEMETEKAVSPPATTQAATADESLYDKATALYREKNYQAARQRFSEYLDRNPTGKKVPDAYFWLGNSLFDLKEYELSILEYQRVIIDFPDHDLASAALLQQGMAFEKLNDRETAIIVYNKLLDNYPRSRQAPEAQKRLQNME